VVADLVRDDVSASELVRCPEPSRQVLEEGAIEIDAAFAER
jgi:hypothetical protein